MPLTYTSSAYLGSHFSIKTSYNRLTVREGFSIFEVGPPFPPAAVIPLKNLPEWQHLVDFLEACTWEGPYCSPVEDGTQWELRYHSKTKRLKVDGSNAYPRDFVVFENKLRAVFRAGGYTSPYLGDEDEDETYDPDIIWL
jgi:hypothetical protein